ncbi:PAS domain S-box protein [Roseomonas sp. KE2513]|uniref:PAS domain-containing protein n=1 Tax=Roseomonas sp. KE2513 TaxID=2479202 RepID=UPI0018DF449D|nr:PAS domain-containing protein [Roseomonas sp. KE2513]MBI0538522.1 PAS domain S-box protein [Roseomonas sp. KE2513]
MERLLRLLAGRRWPAAKRYGAAAIIVLAATAVRSILPAPDLPFLFFIPALMAAGLTLGRGPGFFATGLSMILAASFFLAPVFSLALSPQDWLSTLLFGAVCLGIVAVCDALGASLLSREANLAELAASRASLAASEAFLRSVLAASADCIKVLDLDGNLVFMSDGGQRVMEVSDFNLIQGCPWPDFWHGEGHSEAKAAVARARAGERSHFRGHATTMAGTPRYWDVLVTPIFGPDGKPEKLLSVSRDVTDTRTAEDALRDSEAHWRGLFERLREGIILGELVRDARGQVTDWRYLDVNSAWAEQVGLDQRSAVGHTVRELLPSIEQAWIDEPARVVETGEPTTFVREVGGIGRWFEGRMYPIEGDRFTVIFQEVTERHLAGRRQTAIMQLGDRLRDLTDGEAMVMAACETLGTTLDAMLVGYGDVDPVRETITVEHDWTAGGAETLAGTLHFRDYGSYIEDLKDGQTVVVTDCRTDARTRAHATALEARSARAFVNTPLFERGAFVAMLFVCTDQPRAWRAEELAFIHEVGSRLRSAVERVRAEAAQEVLNQEISHRLKNTLAMVLSIAGQTLRPVRDREPVNAFERRIHALSSAHDVLLQKNWASASAHEVVRAAMAGSGQGDRYEMHGADVELGPRSTLSLSLLLHELATNAAKYGALSVPGGRVSIEWRAEGDGDDAQIVFEWTELGGPEPAAPVAGGRKGFGSRLIRMGLVGTGGVELRYPPTGFRALMRASLAQLRRS